jgi:hypothetical protein
VEKTTGLSRAREDDRCIGVRLDGKGRDLKLRVEILRVGDE